MALTAMVVASALTGGAGAAVFADNGSNSSFRCLPCFLAGGVGPELGLGATHWSNNVRGPVDEAWHAVHTKIAGRWCSAGDGSGCHMWQFDCADTAAIPAAVVVEELPDVAVIASIIKEIWDQRYW